MHVETYKDGAAERTILISMLTDDSTAGMVASLFDWEDGGLFEARWSNTLASMAARYYRKYKKAPGRQIETLFAAWCDKHESDKPTTKLMESFLAVLSAEYEREDKPAPDYVKDLAGEYFNKVRLKRLNAKVSDLLDNGDVAEAEALMKSHRKIEVGRGAFLDIFNDRALVESAFAAKDNEPLIEYPGDAGKFLANMLERDVFLAFQGPSKTGKSMFLIDLAYRAVCQRKRTVFFAVGDMSLKQMQHRFYARCARWPYRSKDNTWPHTIKIPTAIKAPPKPKKDEPYQVARVEYAEKKFGEPLSGENAWKACERLLERFVKSQESYFRLSVHPNNSISAEGVEEAIKKLIDEGWPPSCVIIDYADILYPINPKRETRDQTNETWKVLRRMSEEFHCLLVSATQTDAKGYTARTQTRMNFSEDKRKNDHANGIVGLNATDEDREAQVIRWNWVCKREGHYNSSQNLYLGTCLDICNPVVVSTY